MQSVPKTPLTRAPDEEIDPEQAWFSSEEWLEGEREASQQIADGQTFFYEDEEDLERAFVERMHHSG